mmetsp:Transcript_10724/g.15688  ORF Transcript_10724/g.15688 Transcript_10724/m.15688 type:complete len:228 (+) Transcript_10724:4097-4780(+)
MTSSITSSFRCSMVTLFCSKSILNSSIPLMLLSISSIFFLHFPHDMDTTNSVSKFSFPSNPNSFNFCLISVFRLSRSSDVMVAIFWSKLTFTLSTPSTFFSSSSTFFLHFPHFIPVILHFRFSYAFIILNPSFSSISLMYAAILFLFMFFGSPFLTIMGKFIIFSSFSSSIISSALHPKLASNKSFLPSPFSTYNFIRFSPFNSHIFLFKSSFTLFCTSCFNFIIVL